MPDEPSVAGGVTEPTQPTEPTPDAGAATVQPAVPPTSLEKAQKLLADRETELVKIQESVAVQAESIAGLTANNKKLLQEKIDAKTAADAKVAAELEKQGDFKTLLETAKAEHAEALKTLGTESDSLKARDTRLKEIEAQQGAIVTEKIQTLTPEQKAGLFGIVPDFDKLDPFDKAQRLDAFLATTGTKQAPGNPGGNGVMPSLTGKDGKKDKAAIDSLWKHAVPAEYR